MHQLLTDTPPSDWAQDNLLICVSIPPLLPLLPVPTTVVLFRGMQAISLVDITFSGVLENRELEQTTA